MAKKYKDLQARMSPDAQARAQALAERMIRSMPLDELREARELTQEQLARILRVKQSAISKMERRTDMYISTLQSVIKAMGGHLEIRAVFPDGDVRVNQFGDLQSPRSDLDLR